MNIPDRLKKIINPLYIDRATVNSRLASVSKDDPRTIDRLPKMINKRAEKAQEIITKLHGLSNFRQYFDTGMHFSRLRIEKFLQDNKHALNKNQVEAIAEIEAQIPILCSQTHLGMNPEGIFRKAGDLALKADFSRQYPNPFSEMKGYDSFQCSVLFSLEFIKMVCIIQLKLPYMINSYSIYRQRLLNHIEDGTYISDITNLESLNISLINDINKAFTNLEQQKYANTGGINLKQEVGYTHLKKRWEDILDLIKKFYESAADFEKKK